MDFIHNRWIRQSLLGRCCERLSKQVTIIFVPYCFLSSKSNFRYHIEMDFAAAMAIQPTSGENTLLK
jgi:hypothetical protein